MGALSGRRALITGASSGIGEACARAFAGEGANLLLVARRLERLQGIAASIESQHRVQVSVHRLDVRDRAAVEGYVAALTGELSEIHVLVNNAGLARGLGPLHEGEPEDWEEMIDANLKGLLWVTRAVVPGMVARGTGHVINIGSLAGHESYPGGNVYCATKHGVATLTRCLAMELLGTGVRVSSVDPGLVETEFSMVRFHGDAERAASIYRGLDPLTADDVAEAVLFCATRPPNANVRELLLTAGAQASTMHAWRRPE